MAGKGDNSMRWVQLLLLDESGRLYPLAQQGLDLATQQEILRAVEELSQVTTARLSITSMPRVEV